MASADPGHNPEAISRLGETSPAGAWYQPAEMITHSSFRPAGIARRVAQGRQRRRAKQWIKPTVILYGRW
jgi:hypothetical protein